MCRYHILLSKFVHEIANVTTTMKLIEITTVNACSASANAVPRHTVGQTAGAALTVCRRISS